MNGTGNAGDISAEPVPSELATVVAQIDTWLAAHPDATPAQRTFARVLRENVATLLRIDNDVNRRRTLSAVERTEQIFQS
jgi:hypothetical protein